MSRHSVGKMLFQAPARPQPLQLQHLNQPLPPPLQLRPLQAKPLVPLQSVDGQRPAAVLEPPWLLHQAQLQLLTIPLRASLRTRPR